MTFDPSNIRTLPDDCPLLEQYNKLRDFVLGLNPELIERFGPDAEVNVQRISTESMEYKELGFRWFIILPWPKVQGKNCKKLSIYLADKIKSFDTVLEAESFGYTTTVAGGAYAIMVGLREKF